MGRLKIGVGIDSFRLGVKDALRTASRLGVTGVQIPVTSGELAPENFSRTGRRQLLKLLNDLNLKLSALQIDFGEGFIDPDRNNELVERAGRVVDLAIDLRTDVIVTHLGVIPEDEGAWQTLLAGVGEAAGYAEHYECCFASETGGEAPPVLRRFLETLGSAGARVNYDPANLAMRGIDPVAGVAELQGYIVHTHARDGIRNEDESYEEVPLGEGSVPFDEWVEALIDETDYDGFFTIDRKGGPDPIADVLRARELLARY